MKWMSAVILLLSLPDNAGFAQEVTLKPVSSWTVPTDDQVVISFQQWLDKIQPSKANRQSAIALLDRIHDRKNTDIIDLILETIGQIRPDIRQLTSELDGSTSRFDARRLDSLGDDNFVLDHVRLLVARHFVQSEMYDEAIELFEQLSLSRVLDPASLLFYKAIAEHQLIRKDACLESAEKLLENESELPLRYLMLAQLIVADMKPLKEDSLDEIARLMGDIERRQKLNRAGMRVLGQEEEVIRKLDKLIDQIQQQQAMQQKPQQSSQQDSSSKPLDDSQIAGGLGSGETQPKSMKDGGEWGNLPQKDRAAALAEMAKDLPPHYRSVIEEYFRRLAKPQDK